MQVFENLAVRGNGAYEPQVIETSTEKENIGNKVLW